MSTFPSKWFDFNSYKELKRLRNEVKNKVTLKIQIATSIMVAIVSFFLEGHITDASICIQIIVCSILCAIVALIFFCPYIIQYFLLRKECNVFIKGKDAVSIFDDEIVYDVMVASEYYNLLQDIPNNDLKSEIKEFYMIEINYYISESVKRLVLFSSNHADVFGNKENRISFERINNILKLINKIINKTPITLNDELQKNYNIFIQTLQSLQDYKE